MIFVDTHSHIYFSQFDIDRDETIKRAKNVGVEKIIVPSTSPQDYHQALELAERYDHIYAAIGTHPYDAHLMTDQDFQKIKELASHSKVVAVGETGLDFHHEGSQIEAQIASFERHLLIAQEADLPVIVHCRMAKDEVLALLEKHRPRGVVHCFSEDLEFAQELFEIGMHISFTGVLTYESSKRIQEVAREGDLNRIMIETDAPFLKPGLKRTEDRSEPADVVQIAEKIAELRGISVEEVAEKTTKNATQLFGLNS